MEVNTLKRPHFAFTQIPNSFLDNPTLSAKAKGIMAYLLSKPDNWSFYATDIVSHFKDGRDGISTGMDELEQAGFLSRNRVKNEKGQFVGWEYEIRISENGNSDFGESDTNNTNNISNTKGEKENYIKEKEAVKDDPIPMVIITNKQIQALDIYKAYPRHVGKPLALKAITKALGKVSFEQLKAKTEAYAEAVRKSNKSLQYVPMPSTWFNQERYNDDIEEQLPYTPNNNYKTNPPMRPRTKAEILRDEPHRAQELANIDDDDYAF